MVSVVNVSVLWFLVTQSSINKSNLASRSSNAINYEHTSSIIYNIIYMCVYGELRQSSTPWCAAVDGGIQICRKFYLCYPVM